MQCCRKHWLTVILTYGNILSIISYLTEIFIQEYILFHDSQIIVIQCYMKCGPNNVSISK